MMRLALRVAIAVALFALMLPAFAHDTPFSYVDLHLKSAGIEATIEAPAADFAHYLPAVEPDMLLTSAGAEAHKAAMCALLSERFHLLADTRPLPVEWRGVAPAPERKNVRFAAFFAWEGVPKTLEAESRLFPYDPRHTTYLNIYEGSHLERQAIFDAKRTQITYAPGSRQMVLEVVKQFFVEGVHHIFIGPDHILFIVGLLLLGGTLRQLLKIVTAFTVAHSITLALATLNILSPSARIIEPTIALSIVFVGVHSLICGKEKRDLRMLFAFCFGFIHGFGFASVLRELDLPRQALGWSLFSFNVGVEFGQMCIVLTVLPLLAALHKHSERIAQKFVLAASVVVILAGGFWFVQRVFWA
ncbi:MAG TPA: HupE/UreJ family protein [Chthonomonadaceae bacterium]|nr:HupE/UreJ family protein [Chthonomonadaceae bacterium]